MSHSNSNLLNYIALLLHDDDALRTFLIDPVTEPENTHNITKAERAVLRRTVFHLSNRSLNGYTIARHFGSYRRSLRLLQNVLHNVGSKMVQDAHSATADLAPGLDQSEAGATQDAAAAYRFSLIYNLPNVGANGSVDFTARTNADVDRFGGPYAISTQVFTVSLPISNPTIQDVMDAVNRAYSNYMPYKTVKIDGEFFVSALLPRNKFAITADLSNPDYSKPGADYVFWFWSVNGRANPSKSGKFGESFASRRLNPGDTVFWQLIAPDARYGFHPCSPTEGNQFALAARAAAKGD